MPNAERMANGECRMNGEWRFAESLKLKRAVDACAPRPFVIRPSSLTAFRHPAFAIRH
jgi:hypothetical protein